MEYLCEHGPVALNDAARLAWDCFEHHGRVLMAPWKSAREASTCAAWDMMTIFGRRCGVDQFAIVPEVRSSRCASKSARWALSRVTGSSKPASRFVSAP